MRVLITGATGFIGQKLVARLKERGDEVVVLSRGHNRKCGDSIFLWDPMKSMPPEHAFHQVDAVINLAGEGIANKRWTPTQKEKILKSRTVGTHHLVQRINQLSQKPKTFISASAIGYYGDRGNEELTEMSAPGTGFLADVSKAWEEEADGVSSDVRLVKIRIGVVLGREGGMLQKLLPLFKLGLGGPVGSGNQWLSWIHVDDLVEMFLFALDQNAIKGAWNGVAPQPVTNAEFGKTLGRTLGRPAFFWAPGFMIKLIMGELSTLVLGSTLVKSVTTGGRFSFRFPQLSEALHEITKKKDLASPVRLSLNRRSQRA